MEKLLATFSKKYLQKTLMFTLRSEADYDDFKTFTLEEVEDAKSAVRLLINEIDAFLRNT